MEDQKLTNALFLLSKYVGRPLPEHEALVYIQLSRWVENICKLQNLNMEAEIASLEGSDDE